MSFELADGRTVKVVISTDPTLVVAAVLIGGRVWIRAHGETRREALDNLDTMAARLAGEWAYDVEVTVPHVRCDIANMLAKEES